MRRREGLARARCAERAPAQVIHALVTTAGDFEDAAAFLRLSKGKRCARPCVRGCGDQR